MRNNDVNIRMRRNRFTNIIKALRGSQLKESVNVSMCIVNDDIPSGVVRVVGQFRRQARRQVTMIKPVSVVQFEQLPFYAAYQPHKSVRVVRKVIHCLDEAGSILRVLRMEGLNDVPWDLPFGDLPSQNVGDCYPPDYGAVDEIF